MSLIIVPSSVVEQHDHIPKLKAQTIESFYRSQNALLPKPRYKLINHSIDALFCALQVQWFEDIPEAEFKRG